MADVLVWLAIFSGFIIVLFLSFVLMVSVENAIKTYQKFQEDNTTFKKVVRRYRCGK